MPDALMVDEVRILVVRLPGDVSKDAFEAQLHARVPQLHGPVLNWLFDDYFALPQAAAQTITVALGTPARVVDALSGLGAVQGRWLTWEQFRSLYESRDPQAGPSSQPLRDRQPSAGIWVDPPEFGIETEYNGRKVLLDWHLVTTGITAAWGLFGTAPGALPWHGLRVGHIDTGYTEHPALGWASPGGTWLRPDLGLNLFKDFKEEMANRSEAGQWWNAVPEFPGPRDNLTGANGGHGTRTSSTVCGHYDTGEPEFRYPFFGAAPGATLIPYRITDAVLIDHVPDLLASAIRHAVTERQCDVVSISLGAIFPSRAVASAIDLAYERGVIVCAAAGNFISEVTYPGRYNRVVTVGGADTSDGRSLFPWSGASRGKYVDVSGPADRIRRANTVGQVGQEEFKISRNGDGTSFATALCAGMALLWLAYRADDLQNKYGSEGWARAAAFKRLVKATALKPDGWDAENFGTGVYLADRLLQAPLPELGDLHHEAPAWDPFDPRA